MGLICAKSRHFAVLRRGSMNDTLFVLSWLKSAFFGLVARVNVSATSSASPRFRFHLSFAALVFGRNCQPLLDASSL